MASAQHYDPAAHARRMRAGGWWVDRTVDSLFAQAAATWPEKPAIIAYRADRPAAPPRRISFAELADLVARAAAALRALGVGHGDIVALQLPNWWEFAVATLAAGRIGAVVNPLMPILRQRELGYMLGFAAAKVFIVPAMLRGFDHAAMARELAPRLPALQRIIIADSDGPDGFERVLLSGTARVAPAECPMRPDEMSVLMFTSGTTGEPKGVMHCDNSLNACMRGLRARFRQTEDDVLLGCSPFGHMTGYCAVLLQGLCQGSTVVFQDVWNAQAGVAIMAAEGVTHVAAATTFLADICDAAAATGTPLKLRTFLCGGAPIPPVQIARAITQLNLPASSLWGMTEALGGTLTEPERAQEKSASSDGRPVDGMDIRIVDETGRELPPGESGRLLVRGAAMALGYYKRPDLTPYDAEGWLDTGDLAYADAEGYIRISGRSKDVVIRGGENVPVVEIENLLYQHPAVAAAAVVGFPDARLGEKCCAFIVPRAGAGFTLQDLQAYMAQCQVAKPFWPERVELLEAMPTTASGKIQKYVLRQRAAQG